MAILRPNHGPARDPEPIHQIPRSGPLGGAPGAGWLDPDGAEGDVEFHPDDLLGDRPGENPQACPVQVDGVAEVHADADSRWNGTTYTNLAGGSPVRVVNAYPARSSVLLVNIGVTDCFLGPDESVGATAFTLQAGASVTLATKADVWANAAAGAVFSLTVAQTLRDG